MLLLLLLSSSLLLFVLLRSYLIAKNVVTGQTPLTMEWKDTSGAAVVVLLLLLLLLLQTIFRYTDKLLVLQVVRAFARGGARRSCFREQWKYMAAESAFGVRKQWRCTYDHKLGGCFAREVDVFVFS